MKRNYSIILFTDFNIDLLHSSVSRNINYVIFYLLLALINDVVFGFYDTF